MPTLLRPLEIAKSTDLSRAFKIKDKTMDNVQNCDSYINIPSAQNL
jgi:hypothetical protein